MWYPKIPQRRKKSLWGKLWEDADLSPRAEGVEQDEGTKAKAMVVRQESKVSLGDSNVSDASPGLEKLGKVA